MPGAGSIALEVPVLRSATEHGHRTEAESLYGLQSFSGEVEGITWITNEDIIVEEVSIAVPRIPEDTCGVFERREVIRCVVSKENLLRFYLLEDFNVPRLEEFSLNAAPEVWPVLLTFEHIEDGTNVFLGATEHIIVENDPAVSNGNFNRNRLIDNYEAITAAFTAKYANFKIAYSFKTNYLNEIVTTVQSLGALADVVSLY